MTTTGKTAPDRKRDDQPDAAAIIAQHLAAVHYTDLSAATVVAAKASILDTLGCILAGTALQDVKTITALMTGAGGRPCSTIIGSGGVKVPPVSATFCNGAAIHQYDFDDVHDRSPCHPTSSSLVPALAVAEDRGGVSGKEFICAVALGSDLTARLSGAILGNIHDYPWFRAQIVGLFGATAAAAKIWGASAQQHLDALGLALPQVGGTWASLHHPGSSVRSIRDGLSYRNGVLAAELAMQGIRGDREVFEGPYGFFQAYFKGEYRRADLLGELGVRNELAHTSLKPWPSIRHLHTTLTAVLDAMKDNELQFEDIDKVILSVGKTNRDRCRPVPLGSVPANHIDLLNNMHFAVAAAIRHRGLPLALYRDTALADEVIRESMPKVQWRYDSTLDVPWTFEDGRIEIHTTGGKVHKAECRIALGNPKNPMSTRQRHDKFIDCALAAARPLSEAQSRSIIDVVEHLEDVADIASLTRIL